jgi:hypothetical protein
MNYDCLFLWCMRTVYGVWCTIYNAAYHAATGTYQTQPVPCTNRIPLCTPYACASRMVYWRVYVVCGSLQYVAVSCADREASVHCTSSMVEAVLLVYGPVFGELCIVYCSTKL